MSQNLEYNYIKIERFFVRPWKRLHINNQTGGKRYSWFSGQGQTSALFGSFSKHPKQSVFTGFQHFDSLIELGSKFVAENLQNVFYSF